MAKRKHQDEPSNYADTLSKQCFTFLLGCIEYQKETVHAILPEPNLFNRYERNVVYLKQLTDKIAKHFEKTKYSFEYLSDISLCKVTFKTGK